MTRQLNRIFKERGLPAELPLASIIAGLWRNGEQGVWYDPSDLATMFQDAAGTLPVYAPGGGQVDPPVGLLLDKRLGLTLGSERLANGSFDSGAAGWTVSGQDATHVVTFSGGQMRYQSDTVSPQLKVEQPAALIPGRWYVVETSVASWVSGAIKTDSFVAASQVLASGPGIIRVVGLAASSTFILLRSTPNVDMTLNHISVRELQGNHAYQTTTTSRPTLSARYNTLLASEKFDDPYWAITQNFDVAKTAETADPDGGGSAWKITSTTGTAALSKVIGAGYRNPVLTVWVKSGTHTPGFLVRNTTTATNLISRTAAQTSDFSNTYGICTNSDIGNGWRRIRIEITSGVATSDQVAIYFGATGAVPVGQYFYLYRIDVREANDGVGLPPYQRVVDANTYDTVGFPPYLRFDGVDDGLQTADIDFTAADKIFFTAAVRKISDSATAIVAELSMNSSNVNGAFLLAAPSSGGVNKFRFMSKGTAPAEVFTTSSLYSAPFSALVSGRADIAADDIKLLINSTTIGSSATDQGTGNFGKHPLFIGKRGIDGTLAFSGRLYNLFIRGAYTSDPLVAKVERYLNQKAKVF